MNCIVTVSSYTAEEDFSLADRVVPDLGDAPGKAVTIRDLMALVC